MHGLDTSNVSSRVESRRVESSRAKWNLAFNGEIAIQWEWSKFDPTQNSNPLTDYDKTLHS